MKNKSYKSYKTPLRYPGGKSRAIKRLIVDVPENFSEFREPFLGGGSMAIEITKRYPDVDVWVNDMYYNLYNFWVQLRDNGDELYNVLLSTKKQAELNECKERLKHRKLFDNSKSSIDDDDDLIQRAAKFYVLNKCSFSGLGQSSSFSKMASESNFSIKGIEKLPYYSELIKNWKITNLDYNTLLTKKANEGGCFIFLDPPYSIKDNLYGKNGDMHSGFDHMRFYEDVSSCDESWMITYNSNEVLRERFSKYNQLEWDLTYTMRSTGEYMKEP